MRTGSLCTGYGGLDMAIHEVLGGELAWVADIDPGAAAILAHRFPLMPNLGDISKTDWSAIEPVDVLTAGFPCQDISYAGRGEGIREGNRSGLWYKIADAIGVLRPGVIVLENVAAIVGRRPGLDVVLGDLARLGFDAEWTCLRASDADAPHGRKRLFLVAWPAADPGSRSLQRRGVRGVLAGEERAAANAWDQRQWHGNAADDRRPAPQDADRTAGGQRGVAAPGQAPGGWPRPDSGGSGGASAALADADCDGLTWGEECDGEPIGGHGGHEQRRVYPLRRVLDWGVYEAAVCRWEAILGRPAPRPTEPGRTGERLSPRFVEWMMGLPEGWVTDVPGLTRNAQLKALGNGVVPQQAAMALRMLLERADAPLVAVEGAA